MPRSRILTIYALLIAFALGAGMLIANFFGSTEVLPSGYATVVDGTSSVTETVSTSPSVEPTPVASITPLPAALTASTSVATTLALETPTPEPPTSEPTAEPPTATSEQPTAPPDAGYVEYTVQKGDTLKSIAEANGVTIQDILAMNQIENPDSLTVGTVLRIPTV